MNWPQVTGWTVGAALYALAALSAGCLFYRSWLKQNRRCRLTRRVVAPDELSGLTAERVDHEFAELMARTFGETEGR